MQKYQLRFNELRQMNSPQNPPSGLRKTAKPLGKTLHPARAGKGWRKFRYINMGV